MKIITKFDLGQEINIIEKRRTRNTCPLCSGKKVVTIIESLTSIRCPKCMGRGYTLDFDNTKWKVMEYPKIIEYIRVEKFIDHANSDNRTIYKAMVHDKNYMMEEKNMFLTLTQAQLECDRRNENGE